MLTQNAPTAFRDCGDMGDNFCKMSVTTIPADFLLQLQVLTAFVSDPAYRPEALQAVQAANENYIKIERMNAPTVLGSRLATILRSNDKRWSNPSLADVRSISVDGVKKIMGPVLATRPIEITVVGDVTMEAAVDGVARTFGALPKRNA